MNEPTNLAAPAPARRSVPALPAWVLERARDAELESGHPVLAALLGAHPARRGLVCAILALTRWPEIADRLAAAGGAADAGALFRMPGRRLLRQILGPVPGLPGALARVGPEPLEEAEDYGLLLGILTYGSRKRRQVLAHLAAVTTDAIRALAILDEAFLSVGVTGRISCARHARAANEALAFLRRSSSLAGTAAGEQALIARCQTLDINIGRWLHDAMCDIGDDFPRGPLPDGPGLRQLVRGSEFCQIGRAWRNCLSTTSSRRQADAGPSILPPSRIPTHQAGHARRSSNSRATASGTGPSGRSNRSPGRTAWITTPRRSSSFSPRMACIASGGTGRRISGIPCTIAIWERACRRLVSLVRMPLVRSRPIP